jgi:hypothetical protein
LPLTPITPNDVYRRGRPGGKFLTLDSQRRLALSAAFREELAIKGVSAWIVVSYDVKTKTIGIVKQDVEKVPNAHAFKVDQRGYISAGGPIMDKLGLSVDGAPYRFEDIGFIDEGGVRWRAFRLVDESN